MAAGSSSSPPPPLRIVIFPWLAFGHLLPYLELAELLASRGHRVSFVSTPGNAFDGLAAPFADFLAGGCADERRRPDWVIVDCLHHWAAAAAVEHKVPSAMLLPSAAYLATSEMLHDESKRRPPHTNHGAGGMSIAQRFFSTLDRCALAVIRSCVEWEPEFLPQVPPLLRKPVVPLGLLPPSPDAGGEDDGAAAVRWLDAQPPSSLVYVAMGSEVPLRVEQVHELALGLELAGTRFLWALRKPASGGGVSDDGDAGILPPGFQERTQGQGLVTMGWVPQVRLLAHGAVGGFSSCCRSEGIRARTRLMEGKKVGLQVARDEKDGSFDRHGVASAVRAVMVEEETRRVFVANARKAQEIVADEELQDSYMDQFVQKLRSYTADDGGSATTSVAPPSAAGI
ncbi:unnamed protein product [Urochloa decumbens]|uniref:Uncharacterized protein n=1 Tax=Urochloa decumbens TaxID=240449 RepID=A0ABC8Y1P1_9POAL